MIKEIRQSKTKFKSARPSKASLLSSKGAFRASKIGFYYKNIAKKFAKSPIKTAVFNICNLKGYSALFFRLFSAFFEFLRKPSAKQKAKKHRKNR